MNISFKTTMVILGCSLFLSACASDGKDKGKMIDPAYEVSKEDVEKHRNEQAPVEELYKKAAQTLKEGRNVEAAGLFDDVERQYPYSQWATKAQMMAGYSYYKDLKYDDAALALDRFIQLHPGDKNIAYAYYLRALCYYEQISDVRRDQEMTELALYNLSLVVSRFPESKYARDANLKIDLTRDHLAGKEMEIGRYYLIRGHYQASLNRFKKVVDLYQTTTHVPEALHRMTEAYISLGIIGEARKTAAILGHNYPGSKWYQDSYALLEGKGTQPLAVEERGVFERTFGRIF